MTKDMLETLRRIARGSESESLYIRKNEKRFPSMLPVRVLLTKKTKSTK